MSQLPIKQVGKDELVNLDLIIKNDEYREKLWEGVSGESGTFD